jgi:hypothetical protein
MAQLDQYLIQRTKFALPKKPKLAGVLVDQLLLGSQVHLRRRLMLK